MSAPTLYLLAADLRRMRVNASLDESDIGLVLAGQPVTFTVDAYPGETFAGRVAQVRLQPVVSQNVVTYTTVIEVDNPELKLKPGMTATVSIETARRDNVLTVPASALRFKPTAEVLAALGGTAGAATAPAGATTATPAAGQAGVGRGSLWRYDGMAIASLKVTTGISDGVTTEIVGGPIAEGDAVVTSVATTTGAAGSEAKATAGAPRSPLITGPMGPPPGGPR
jgi:HlyD family secretion protein